MLAVCVFTETFIKGKYTSQTWSVKKAKIALIKGKIFTLHFHLVILPLMTKFSFVISLNKWLLILICFSF